MIIYGTKSSKGKLVNTNCQCPFCGTHNALAVLPYQKSAHVYWIPIFPIGREYFVVCKACGKDAPDHYIGGITPEIKKQVGFPWTSFIGLFILGGLILWGVVSGIVR